MPAVPYYLLGRDVEALSLLDTPDAANTNQTTEDVAG
jgi:hypothetical protein